MRIDLDLRQRRASRMRLRNLDLFQNENEIRNIKLKSSHF